MTKAQRIPPRSDVRTEDTWDLTPLFRNDAAWERVYRRLERKLPSFDRFRGKLGRSAKALHACCCFETEFERELERLGSYAQLKASEDVAEPRYQGMLSRYVHLATRAGEAASFIAPEIRGIPRARMAKLLKAPVLQPFRFPLEKLLRFRPHILSEPEERLLAMQGEVATAPSRVFGQLNDADLTFGFVDDERGRPVELTQNTFRSLLESPRRSVRKKAFHQFYAVYEAHRNTLAATFSASVVQDVYQARARRFPSALEAALFPDRVPVAVYDSLIAAVHNHLGAVHRYLELRRKALRLKELRFYDTYVPIVPVERRQTPYDEAATLVCEALAPLGPEYCRTLEQGLRGRWVDRYENQGKQSGAFSAGAYASPPYILMNYRDDVLDHVFTLAHEAGHSMHTYYSARRQPFQLYQYAIFAAEVASTFNEQLLNQHLLEQATDRRMRAFLLNREIDEIRGTLVRQTMFAEFEKIAHAIAERGEPLTEERVRQEYRALLDLYFGPEFVMDDALSLECLRIPHFYHAFYVYKYATGLAAAVALAGMIREGGRRERDRYLAFLGSGSSAFPLDLLRRAGVDMESPEPVDRAMRRFARLVEELESLLA